MPLRRKQPPATKPSPTTHSPAPTATPKWKWTALVGIGLLIALSALWSMGVFRELTAGPKIPLPRQVLNLSLGMSMEDVAKLFPGLKKKLRPYNGDAQFKIATVDNKDGVTEASTIDLLFFLPNDKLYFVSTTWNGDAARLLPFSDWAHQYRRWSHTVHPDGENLGSDVLLTEYHFDDQATEMVLRDLKYTDHTQRWQDLRDASNPDAQAAFAKYRLEGVN